MTRLETTIMSSAPFRAIRIAVTAVLLSGVALLAASPPAQALLNHAGKDAEFTVPGCEEVLDIAVLENEGYVYVSCSTGPYSGAIKRFDMSGNPVAFPAVASYVHSNEIFESPTSPTGSLGAPRIAVDNSSAHHGYLYVVRGFDFGGGSPETFEAFDINGAFVTSNRPPGIFPPGPTSVDVGDAGEIFVSHAADVTFVGRLSEFNTSFKEVRRIYTFNQGGFMRTDTTGAAWALDTAGGRRLTKYESDQWDTDIGVSFETPTAVKLAHKAKPSPYAADPFIESANLRNFDVDRNRNDLYVDRGNRIEIYSQGTATEPAYKYLPLVGQAVISGSRAVAVTRDNEVLVSSVGGKVIIFGAGKVVPDVRTDSVDRDNVGHSDFTATGRVELDGGQSITSCLLEYGLSSTASFTNSVPCSPNPAASPPGSNFATDQDVSATATGLTEGAEYRYRFKASNADGSNVGVERFAAPSFVLKVNTEAASGITDEGATLNGSLDPDGIATTYKFQYGPDPSYGFETAPSSAGTGTGVATVSSPVAPLQSGRLWHYRLVATNVNGTTLGQDMTFRTASAPELSGVRATDVTATSAVLNAKVDPVGFETEYQFEFGRTPDYGQVVPLSPAQIGDGNDLVEVSQQIPDLEPGYTYHFRVVATNQWGDSASPDVTFDYAPPSCPNDDSRQETSASYLPDCRAYELVSPSSAGAVLLMPGTMVHTKGTPSIEGLSLNWPQNTGYATSPARFGYWGALGAVSGQDGTGGLLDLYVATRTTSGWVSELPGHTGSEVLTAARKQCTDTLSLCLDHDEKGFTFGPRPQTATVFSALDGEKVDKWPTNLKLIPGGEFFKGSQRPSGDFSNFVFSSSNVLFSPEGMTGGIGSAYNNDIPSRTVSVISKLADGSPITQDGPDSELQRFEFPGISTDGSHIVMRTPAAGGQYHLYVRVDDALTYDIANGAPSRYVDMTRDGSKVYFTTAAQLLPAEDTDSSTDLYRWDDNDELTLVSVGNGEGNGTACAGPEACSIDALDTQLDHPWDLPSVPGVDDLVSEESGDVYFYSPELLDGTRLGVPNEKNLYVYRNGTVRLVATLDKGTSIERLQISPNGDHAAMLTRSQLTPYDNRGFREIYTFDADKRKIHCASCDPAGLPPSSNAEASSNGRFMADDGRTFFMTRERLVPADTNGDILDVYEYVDGRPQLITSGLGSRDFTGGAGVNLIFPGVNISLEAVSHDGMDVFSSTYETLVPQDHNGAFIKFYDARTGGGFPAERFQAPCEAADECHGPDSSEPALPVLASGVSLGKGNAQQTKRKPKRRKGQHRHHKGKRRKARDHRTATRAHAGRRAGWNRG